MLLWILRSCFLAIIIGSATYALVYFRSVPDQANSWMGPASFGVILMSGLAAVGADLLIRNKQITSISAVFFGLLLGLVLGALFSIALEPLLTVSDDPMMRILAHPLRLLITLICCYASISTLLQTKDEFRFIIPYVEFAKQVKGGKPLVLDTSVIIDGRIADLCDTRIVDTKLIVTRFVLQELQGIADSSDKLKRNRGRRGLDILKKLQTNSKIELEMQEGRVPEAGEKARVDERLVLFAKSVGGRVVTNDFNLNKIAQLQGVDVINLNEVANALKTVALPGEGMTIRIVKPGDQPGQGVGYLDDGTMVVVEQGRAAIGHEVGITVTSVLQTNAGRMIFGKIEGKAPVAASAIAVPGEKQKA